MHTGLLELVPHSTRREDAALVDEGREASGRRYVGRGGHYAVGELSRAVSERLKHRPERRLSAHARRATTDIRGEVFGHRNALRRVHARGHAVDRRAGHHLARAVLVDHARVRRPFRVPVSTSGAKSEARAHRVHLLGRKVQAVVVAVAGERKAMSLRGVADEDGAPIGARRKVERLEHRFEAVTTQIRHQRVQLLVVVRADELAEVVHIFAISKPLRVGEEGLAPRGAAAEGERGEARVVAFVNPTAQHGATGLLEGAQQLLAVLEAHYIPACKPEHPLGDTMRGLLDVLVERLAVVVDHDPIVRHVELPALTQRLEHIAFVEFRVADQRDHPSGPRGRHLRMRPALWGEPVCAQVALGQGGKGRDTRAHPNRTRRKVHLR
mmetsp:Transcript_19502/g.50336  ORF Transcript_19502/g.50336 Transcript_19502/m.50336 type:complete len:382 (-) Transcript_19502:611-1756(-)